MIWRADHLLATTYDRQEHWQAQRQHLPRLLENPILPLRKAEAAEVWLYQAKLERNGNQQQAAIQSAQKVLEFLPLQQDSMLHAKTQIAALDLIASILEEQGEKQRSLAWRRKYAKLIWRLAPQDPKWVAQLLHRQIQLLESLGREKEAAKVEQELDMLRRSLLLEDPPDPEAIGQTY